MKSKNRWIGACVISIVMLTFILLYVKEISIPCLFRQVFGISCPSCGMTRAGFMLLQGDVIKAMSYHVLVIPWLLFLLYMMGCAVYDICKNTNTLETRVLKFLEKYIIVILLIVILGWVLNEFF